MEIQFVRNWMTPSPITITPQTTLPEAHRLMDKHNIRRLPVVSKGNLVGIVTLIDLCRLLMLQPERIAQA